MTERDFAREFGRHVNRVRTEVFDESLRDFAKRVELSPSYIGKLENAEVAVPRRETVEQMARKLAMPADPLLLKAGYVPERSQRSEDDEYLLMLIGTLTSGQRGAVRAYIQHVRDEGIVREREAAKTGVLVEA
jgi:transcriptional regulator with XRE-family HTH domain